MHFELVGQRLTSRLKATKPVRFSVEEGPCVGLELVLHDPVCWAAVRRRPLFNVFRRRSLVTGARLMTRGETYIHWDFPATYVDLDEDFVINSGPISRYRTPLFSEGSPDG